MQQRRGGRFAAARGTRPEAGRLLGRRRHRDQVAHGEDLAGANANTAKHATVGRFGFVGPDACEVDDLTASFKGNPMAGQGSPRSFFTAPAAQAIRKAPRCYGAALPRAPRSRGPC